MKRRAFLFGLSAGALGGILLIEFGIGLPFLAAAAIAIGIVVAPIPIGAAGTLVGWGVTWTALLAIAARRCAVDQNCGDSPPNIAPWIAAGFGLIVVGLMLLVLGNRKGGSR